MTICLFVDQSQENMKLYQPWKFPSLVSLPLHPQRGGKLLSTIYGMIVSKYKNILE